MTAWAQAPPHAYYGKRTLKPEDFNTIAELAEREGIAPSYMTLVVRLTLLAPDIIEEILVGMQGPEVTLAKMFEPFSLEWSQQLPNRKSVEDPTP